MKDLENEFDYKLYEKLVYSRAWYYSKKFKLDFDDAKSEGNLIFCESLLTYNKDKGKFSTHLWWNLSKIPQRLNKNIENITSSIDDIERKDVVYPKHFNLNDFKEYAITEISPEAYKILNYCISYEWKEKKYTKNPNYVKLKKKFGYKKREFDKIWLELQNFFRKSRQFDFSEAI